MSHIENLFKKNWGFLRLMNRKPHTFMVWLMEFKVRSLIVIKLKKKLLENNKNVVEWQFM